MRVSLARLAIAFVAFALPVQAQTVHVVDVNNGPGTDFLNISSAVVAAADGDAVLVRAGSYMTGFVIDGKSLVVSAEAGAVVEDLEVTVRNLAAGQEVVIRGIDTVGNGVTTNLSLRNSQGAIWFDDCRVASTGGSPFQNGGGIVESCSSVVFTNCAFEEPMSFVSIVTPTLFVNSNSRVHLFDTTIQGMKGFSGSIFGNPAEPGGVGLGVQSSFVSLTGCVVDGGDGGDQVLAAFPPCYEAGAGGDAVQVFLAGGELVSIGSDITGGSAGTPNDPSCPAPPDGQDILAGLGATTTVLPTTRRSVAITSPTREGQTATATFTGNPGDFVWLDYSPNPSSGVFFPGFLGAFVLGTPVKSVFVGVIPGSGQRVENLSIGELGTDFVSLFLQGVIFDPFANEFVLSSPTAILLLDQSF